jgi:hypothetical protein
MCIQAGWARLGWPQLDLARACSACKSLADVRFASLGQSRKPGRRLQILADSARAMPHPARVHCKSLQILADSAADRADTPSVSVTRRSRAVPEPAGDRALPRHRLSVKPVRGEMMERNESK